MKRLIISLFLTTCAIVALANSDVKNQTITIDDQGYALPIGCTSLEEKRYRFRCILSTGEDVALGIDKNSNFEKIINAPNDKDGVLDRNVEKTSYGYYVKYISRKNGNQYNFIYLKNKKITIFGGDLKLVYFFSMLVDGNKLND
ncbi:hypothetical protein [Paracidovorax valerianellae]|uniref:hypothetical protein n=1 Tax=Paracidovorax valerianellae TaxID=187868 RepID=UPI001587CC82|nr:hypothetical protein [Paracidovorax valerianellae]MDA8447460.1 hypothetical protein [Paracidovorax valerianellae]